MEAGIDMANLKSIAMSIQDVGWLTVVLLICVTIIAAASIRVPTLIRYFGSLRHGSFDARS